MLRSRVERPGYDPVKRLGRPTMIADGVGARITTDAMTRIERYLFALPAGFASHPECQHKFATIRDFIAGTPLLERLDVLPPQVAELVRNPPPVTAWVSEVVANCIFLGIREACCESDEDYYTFSAERSRQMMRRPMYKLMFALITPRRVVKGAGWKWTQFHRGTTMTGALDEDGRGGTLEVRFPPGLMSPIAAGGYAGALRAAFELSSSTPVTLEIEDTRPGSFRYRARW